MPYKDLESYGIIGNLETCALVRNDGSIDWLCLPRLDSPSVFAAILDDERGGRFMIRPKWHYDSSQQYLENTNVLTTIFKCASGTAKVTDFMPVKGHCRYSHRSLFRKVECPVGTISLQILFDPRFNYARTHPQIKQIDAGLIAKHGEQKLIMRCPLELRPSSDKTSYDFTLEAGDTVWFVLQFEEGDPVGAEDCEAELAQTVTWWREWAGRRSEYSEVLHEPYRHLAIRSGLVLKLLENGRGGIAASATMSLPQHIGGVRNWDYRYAWIRDLSFTVQALYHLGHHEESNDFHRWVRETLRNIQCPSDLKPIVPLEGSAGMSEIILNNLLGYKDSAPVRCGNGAFSQKQFDTYGELVGALYDITRYGIQLDDQEWGFIIQLVNYVCEIWHQPDHGIWEIRCEPRHHVHSKLLCWMTVDRGIRIAAARKFNAPFQKWQNEREKIRKAIMEQGFSEKLNSFTGTFGSEDLDASNLTIAATEFLPPTHPRVIGTIEAIWKHLGSDGLLRPYTEEDGLAGCMQGFYLCSFFLVKSLSMAGRTEEAEQVLDDCLQHSGPLGLLSEQVDLTTGKMCGNYPQAFSHIGLINSALYLGIAEGRSYKGPAPVGLP